MIITETENDKICKKLDHHNKTSFYAEMSLLSLYGLVKSSVHEDPYWAQEHLILQLIIDLFKNLILHLSFLRFDFLKC